MKWLDLTLPTPAENLAADEALLDWREENGGENILRFWESPRPFVVVGYANKIATETDAAACEAKGIPIFRRCSGGGTVLQGPGCLSYALILRITANSPLAGISGANRFIMEQNRRAIASLLPGSEISVRGHTDLARDHFKFSGNSQRRRRQFLLFHGTFLLNFDLALVGGCLRMPSREPDYRRRRRHEEFLTNLNVSAASVKAALREIWRAGSLLEDPPLNEIATLARMKYETREWNFKF
ncbi:MAG: lipoate--protein ligase family protein [Verrucomicrobiota bacterium]|nr:lipoate--protein ligase family protein [Verrucomicrobiota bacterium]